VAGPDLHVSWSGSGEPVLLVHGSWSTARDTFAAQAALADEFRLGLVDRRGFGASPDTERVDFERDGDDIAGLLDERAHLVGHSYGGIACMFAAARRPDEVRSLTVIEPPAMGHVVDDPVARGMVERLKDVFARPVDPATRYADFVEAWGLERPDAERIARQDGRALVSSAGERGPWEAVLPLDELSGVPFPKLVVSGEWDVVSPRVRDLAGYAFGAVCDLLERRLGAQRLRVAGAAHAPQLTGPPFNEPLREFLRRA
jgi:pimeloyl-ACP methyl ester carboxylesterase